jgi:hypothetical protein
MKRQCCSDFRCSYDEEVFISDSRETRDEVEVESSVMTFTPSSKKIRQLVRKLIRGPYTIRQQFCTP